MPVDDMKANTVGGVSFFQARVEPHASLLQGKCVIARQVNDVGQAHEFDCRECVVGVRLGARVRACERANDWFECIQQKERQAPRFLWDQSLLHVLAVWDDVPLVVKPSPVLAEANRLFYVLHVLVARGCCCAATAVEVEEKVFTARRGMERRLGAGRFVAGVGCCGAHAHEWRRVCALGSRAVE
eukprot:3937339-Rhodomonas_salina.3